MLSANSYAQKGLADSNIIHESEYKAYNSEWDGSVYPVKLYLKKNLKDPDSYEAIEWSKVQKTNEGYMVRHKYRAKNSFGGYVIENKVFYLNKKRTCI